MISFILLALKSPGLDEKMLCRVCCPGQIMQDVSLSWQGPSLLDTNH